MEESNRSNIDKNLIKTISQLLNLNIFLIGFAMVLVIYICFLTTPKKINLFKSETAALPATPMVTPVSASEDTREKFWEAPNLNEVTDVNMKAQLEYGKDLIVHTASYFGPQGKINRNATNGMNCQNCHLDAGTKVFGNNYGAVAATYPKYRPRSGAIENIYKRVNDCYERSLNGKALDTTSREMVSIAAYIQWLGKDVPKGEKPAGSGFKDMPFLDRPADKEKGKLVYVQKCQSCHQASGEGLLNQEKTAYTYPPLWGSHSYNDGAGLFRISNFAKYAKYNMPFGVNFKSVQLTDEEAWDIAAFVNSQPRPKKDIRKDWPKMEEKPFDHPFGPYADGFSETQHKYGPFKPIKAKLDEMKKIKEKEKEKNNRLTASVKKG